MSAGISRRTSDATVSVVIPVYNHEAYVGAAIESVLSQTRAADEIIVIDDGSSDGSARVVEALARKHRSIRFWSRPNRGAHATLNEGIAAASGALVAILNSDDLFHRQRLARACAALEAEPEAAVFASELSFIDGLDQPIANAWFDDALAFHRRTGELGLSLVNANFLMTTSNLVVRRELFAELGGFAELRYAHDLDFLLRVVGAGKRILIAPRPLLSYRMHGSNTISEASNKVKAEWGLVAALYSWRLAQGAPGAARVDRGKLLGILERHGLTRLVTLALLRLQASGARGDPEHLLADAAFRAELQEAAQ